MLKLLSLIPFLLKIKPLITLLKALFETVEALADRLKSGGPIRDEDVALVVQVVYPRIQASKLRLPNMTEAEFATALRLAASLVLAVRNCFV